MENRRRKNSSGDKFSFPIIPVQEGKEVEFEFAGSVSPGSPKSPADHLFLNGRLLPHYFPCQPASNISSPISYSRSMSRTSSVSSKDSFLSSRSNSTNSRSSCSTSARTSISDSSERKLIIGQGKKSAFTSYINSSNNMTYSNSPHIGVTQRWQFIVTPSPVMKKKRQVIVSGSKKESTKGRKQFESRKQSKEINGKRKVRFWFLRRFFRKLISACKECHAMEPSRRERVSCH